MSKYLKYTCVALMWLIVVGVVAPQLVSAKSDVLVLFGISLVIFGVVPASYFIIKSTNKKES
ncbi:MAG: hypothetical protein ACRC8W_00635 [Plesiomonas shigelloides]